MLSSLTPTGLLLTILLGLPCHQSHFLTGHKDPNVHDHVLETPTSDPSRPPWFSREPPSYQPNPMIDPRCNENNKNCRVSGDSLTSVLQMFFCRSDLFCSSTTETEKKTFLAGQIFPYIDLSMADLVEMDSCQLVPLVNLVMYHKNNLLEMGKKNTTEQYRNLIVKQVSSSHLPVLLNWKNVADLDATKMLDRLDTVMLVSLGCQLENLQAIRKKVRDLGGLMGASYADEVSGNGREGRSDVWCGGHSATDCPTCPYDENYNYHGSSWCNGDCWWTSGSCYHSDCPSCSE